MASLVLRAARASNHTPLPASSTSEGLLEIDPNGRAARSKAGMNRTYRALCLISLLTLLGCDDEADPICIGDSCLCEDRPRCRFGCEQGGCEADCARTDLCRFACSAGCDVTCSDTDHCDTRCGERCSLSCARAASCDLTCGEECDLRCADVASCEVALGSGQVECTRLGSCAVSCSGPCSVSCSSVGSCALRCAPGLVRCEEPGLVRCAERC